VIDLAIACLGNIGVAFANFVARMQGIRSAIVIDRDCFGEKDTIGQLVGPGAAGRPKAEYVAALMAEVNPGLRVEPFHCPLEHVPRGFYRGRVIATCPDNRLARVRAGDIAWAVRSPLWLDAGVRPDGRLARVSHAFPALEQAACHCCGWNDRDWSLIAADYSCMGAPSSPPSRSPAYLGAAAAAMMAHVLERFLAGQLPASADAGSRTLTLEAHRSWTTAIRRNPACRCRHQAWNIEPLGRGADACGLSELPGSALAVPGLPWVRRLRCACGLERETLYLAARLSAPRLRCGSCGGAMSFGALDLADEIDLSALEAIGSEIPALALAELGICNGDVIRLGDRLLEVGASVASVRKA